MTILDNIWRYFSPSSDMGMAEFSARNIFNEEGRPFDFLAFPHMVAPGGPMDHFDAAWCRELVMQWASRLGKTFIVLCGSLWFACLAPCNQILAGHVEDLGLQQTERIRQMGSFIPQLVDAGLEKTLKKRLKFGGNTIYAAWARSPGTLSNINCLYGGASELDLWEKVSTSKHPDPQEMFGDRFKDNWTIRKEIFESIPTLKGTWIDEHDQEHPRSRIEAKRLTGSDCSLWLGCPHCDHRQVLVISNVEATGYRCETCEQLIGDELRKEFVRSGVWAPRGSQVIPGAAKEAAAKRIRVLDQVSELEEDDQRLEGLRDELYWPGFANCGYLENPPETDGEIWSSQLSSLYALSLTWGDIHDKKSDTQNFINQWLGETMEVDEGDKIDVEEEGRKLAIQITGSVGKDKIPDWASYVVFTGDRQKRTAKNQSPFPWMITAWDEDLNRVHVVGAGNSRTFEAVEKRVKRMQKDMRGYIALIDSGYLTKETYDWCLEMTDRLKMKVWPVKGDKDAAVKHDYKLAVVEDEKGRKSTYRKLKRIHINTQSTQEWCVQLLENQDAISLYSTSPENHQLLCQQLVNDHEEVKQTRRVWNRIDFTIPNDQRDNLRYAYVAAQIAKSEGLSRTQAAPPPAIDQKEAGFIRRKDGGGGFIRRRT